MDPVARNVVRRHAAQKPRTNFLAQAFKEAIERHGLVADDISEAARDLSTSASEAIEAEVDRYLAMVDAGKAAKNFKILKSDTIDDAHEVSDDVWLSVEIDFPSRIRSQVGFKIDPRRIERSLQNVWGREYPWIPQVFADSGVQEKLQEALGQIVAKAGSSEVHPVGTLVEKVVEFAYQKLHMHYDSDEAADDSGVYAKAKITPTNLVRRILPNHWAATVQSDITIEAGALWPGYREWDSYM